MKESVVFSGGESFRTITQCVLCELGNVHIGSLLYFSRAVKYERWKLFGSIHNLELQKRWFGEIYVCAW